MYRRPGRTRIVRRNGCGCRFQYRTTLTIEDGVVRRLAQAEWLKSWHDLQRLGGPNDVRTWDYVSPRERALLKRP